MKSSSGGRRAVARRRQLTRSSFTQRFRGLRVATLLLIAALVWLGLNVGSLRRFINTYQQRNLQRDSVETLREKVAELEEQKRSLELGMFDNEKSVREAYRLVHPGEKLILLNPEEKRTSDSATGSGVGKTP